MSTRDERIRLDVTGADKSVRDLDRVGDAAEGVGGSVFVMGKESDRASKKIDDLGDQAVQTGGQLSRLERDALKARAAVASLNDEYERTGSDSVLGKLQAQQAEYSKIEAAAKRVRSVSKAIAEDAERAAKRQIKLDRDVELSRRSLLGRLTGQLGDAGKSAIGLGGSALESAFGGGDIKTLLLALGGLAAAPIAGAGLGGALLFGGATAAAGGGLAGAFFGDPDKYEAKFSKITSSLKQRWLADTKDLSLPLERGLDEVDRIVRDLPLDRFADAAKGFADPLINGFGGFITEGADGLADFLDNAQPVVREVGPKLVNLGRDLGDFFRAISSDSEGGAIALGDLVDAIGYTIRAVGVLISGFEKAYVWQRNLVTGLFDLQRSMPLVGDATEFVAHKVFDLGSTSMVSARALGHLGDEADDTALGVAGLSAAIDEYRSNALGMADANIALAQGWINLNKELTDGKRTLDLSTQAGIDNASAIQEQVKNAEAARQKQIQLTGDVDAANKAFAENVEQIRKAAYAAGFNKDQVDALLVSLGAVDKVDATANVKVTGLANAIEGAGMLGRLLANIPGTYNAHVNVSGPIGPERHAAGGAVRNTGFSLVGEQGPELIWANRGDQVLNATDTARVLAASAPGTSGGGMSSGAGARGQVGLSVLPGADTYVGQLIQRLFDAGMIQVFVNGQPVTTRPY